MRRPIIAGNWKMNMTVSEAIELVKGIIPLVKDASCDIVVCPPAVDLLAVKQAIAGSAVKLGAQNVHWAESGAFTGEISPKMLVEIGVEYVIVGHSERRGYFGETDEMVNKRALAALSAGLTPIICVGESLEQRENGENDEFVSKQTREALKGFLPEQVEKTVIAYEPIWAIGTGKTASADDADAQIEVIRATVAQMFGDNVAANMRMQYGGSMNAKNADALMSMVNIDGGLIGGASLKPADFAAICAAAK